MPSNPDEENTISDLHTSLLQIIDTAPPQHLRLVLQTLCTDSKLIRRALLQFQTLKSPLHPININHKKRKSPSDSQPIWQTCVQCSTPFDETDNTFKACCWHPGNREVDFESDCWDDVIWNSDSDSDEEDGGGRKGGKPKVDFSAPETVEEFPEGYIWDCCDEYGDAPGCMEGRHKAKEVEDVGLKDLQVLKRVRGQDGGVTTRGRGSVKEDEEVSLKRSRSQDSDITVKAREVEEYQANEEESETSEEEFEEEVQREDAAEIKTSTESKEEGSKAEDAKTKPLKAKDVKNKCKEDKSQDEDGDGENIVSRTRKLSI